ncbi:hypothetical protein B0H19DRAFT_1071141 [Mycena capillaripes]|nr:hypothetical protein B0H19DRAFT_1071141 [Mycena capillaripes]
MWGAAGTTTTAIANIMIGSNSSPLCSYDHHVCAKMLASGNAAELRANLVAIKAEVIQHKNELCVLEKREREVDGHLAHVEFPVTLFRSHSDGKELIGAFAEEQYQLYGLFARRAGSPENTPRRSVKGVECGVISAEENSSWTTGDAKGRKPEGSQWRDNP